MTIEKFEHEIDVLKRFFELYCKDKHENLSQWHIEPLYKNKQVHKNLYLCKECLDAVNYSISRLQDCPHEIKPRCRNCPSPCYDKPQWRNTAKVMKYSGMRLGLTRIKSKIKEYFSFNNLL